MLVASTCGGAEIEAQRLSTDDFYRGLVELRLLHLLDYQLRAHPPDDTLTEELVRRDMRLSVATDSLTDAATRRRALADANDILTRLIREHGSDERAIDWQIALGTSLIYEEAEPHYTSILFRGPTPDDQTALLALMGRAIDTLTSLFAHLEREYARIDELSLVEYEQLEESGYVAKIEAAMPLAEYMTRWAKFYKAIALSPESPERRTLLSEVHEDLVNHTSLLTEDHSVTHVQAQSLLLAGMCCRRLSDHESAARMLQDAIRVASSISNPQERRDLQWLVTLASVERVGALLDSGQVDQAEQAFHEFQGHIRRAGRVDFGHQLMQALLAGRIQQARAGGAGFTGESPLTAPMTDQAMRPLMDLAGKDPAYRDEIYATLYSQLLGVADPRLLHPFQQCVVIAGHIAAANRLRHQPTGAGGAAVDAETRRRGEAEAIALLDQAIALARSLTESRAKLSDELYCEALYNLAVAEHHRGKRADAAEGFRAVATRCTGFPRALSAATYGAEIAAELAEEPSLRERPEVRKLLLDTLDTLVNNFGGSEAAEYWRFFYAQALEDSGSPEQAAEQYARVGTGHDHYIVAQFRAVRCHVRSLAAFVAASPEDLPAIKRMAGNAREEIERFRRMADGELARAASPNTESSLRDLLAESDVLLAEMNILPGVDRPADALTQLAHFESRFPQSPALLGRVLRARIVAYEATGQLREARDAVPDYIASDPKNAGATLQTLFDTTRAEIERYRAAKRDDLAEKKAQSALLFADQIYTWAKSRPELAGEEELFLLRLQLAEANLAAGQTDSALQLFRQCYTQDQGRYDDGVSHSPQVVTGLAESLYRLKNYAEALTLYNRAYREAPEGSAQRFAALLGDLRCRTEMGEDPAGIVNAIRQHRYLNPSLGGDELKGQFAELQERNERRAESQPKP
jgi:tetratricopeptide (TPR) repeat protein